MLLGEMNNARLPLEDELRRIAEGGFEFVDLTLEPPGAWPPDGARIARLLAGLGLPAVGHTAPGLPIASPFPEVREDARRVFALAFDAFAAAGVRLVTVHPDSAGGLFSEHDVRMRNAEAFARLAEEAAGYALRVMVENLGRSFRAVEDLRPILDADERIGFHLDVGHAHMHRARGRPNRTSDLLDAFADRLAHVHVHDNVGGDDLHLPLGVGTIDWPHIVAALHRAGWDGTVTVEVFTRERAYVEVSRRLWREWWDGAAPSGVG